MICFRQERRATLHRQFNGKPPSNTEFRHLETPAVGARRVRRYTGDDRGGQREMALQERNQDISPRLVRCLKKGINYETGDN
ncbi:hypothetical protein ACFLSK_03300 [Chloroflexota bacterium]